jgi:hypothetical protein
VFEADAERVAHVNKLHGGPKSGGRGLKVSRIERFLPKAARVGLLRKQVYTNSDKQD